MSLKVRLNGSSKKIMTGLRLYRNSQWKQATKGFVFINGQKQQLWGNTTVDFSRFNGYFPYTTSYSYMYIDNTRLLVFGDFFQYAYNDGQQVGFLAPDTLSTGDISSVNGDFVSQVQWGKNPLYSVTESTSSNCICYLSTDTTMNKVVMPANATPSVTETYNPPLQSGHKLLWAVKLSNNKKLWCSSKADRYNTYYTLGCDNNIIINQSTGAGAITSPSFGGGTFVVTLSWDGKLSKFDETGVTRIIDNTGTSIESKFVDGNNLLISGSASGSLTAKLIKYDISGNELWHIDFDSSRIPRILGKGGNYYYIIDLPANTNVTDQNVYIKKYHASTGVLSNTVAGTYNKTDNSRIINWYTYPVETKNGMLVAGSTNYYLKVFTD